LVKTYINDVEYCVPQLGVVTDIVCVNEAGTEIEICGDCVELTLEVIEANSVPELASYPGYESLGCVIVTTPTPTPTP
jgi:hypothetical protein